MSMNSGREGAAPRAGIVTPAMDADERPTATLRDVQAAETRLLAEMDRVCRANGITYFLSEGTLLGAVRHGGPIPWDDDVDVCLPRADYERLREVAPDAFAPGFELHTPDDFGDRAFFDFVPHLTYMDSAVHADNPATGFYGGLLDHVLLDIFILDECTPGLSQRLRCQRLKLVYGLSWAHRYRLDYHDYSPAQRVVVFLLSHLGRLWRQTTLNRAYDRISRSGASSTARGADRDAEARYFLGNTLLTELERTYDPAWYTETVDLPYEGHLFCAPAGYEHILTELYGDYRSLPPEDRRVPEHYDFSDPGLRIGGIG